MQLISRSLAGNKQADNMLATNNIAGPAQARAFPAEMNYGHADLLHMPIIGLTINYIQPVNRKVRIIQN